MIKTQSDAFILSVFVTIVSYLFIKIFFLRKLSFYINLFNLALVFLLILIVIINNFSETIINMWNSADEGGVRIDLFLNSIKGILMSPFVGYGIGSFSGIYSPFQGEESHNTFLDIALQFGLITAFILYWIIIMSLFYALKRRDFLFFAVSLGYLSMSMFHFSARHFTFWFELAIFFSYLIVQKNKHI